MNDEILTVVMIESPEAVENAADIAAVDGIDVLLIGSFDLTSALGIAGQMGHRKLIEAYEEVGKACAKHGKVLGMGGINGDEDSRRYIGMGSRFITTGIRPQLCRCRIVGAGDVPARTDRGRGGPG